MESILHVFGIDWKLLLIQVANFFVLLGALSYFLYRPIMRLLDERKGIIEKGVSDAEKAEKALAEAATESDKKIGAAVAEANALIDRAKKEAGAKGQTLLHEAEARGAALVREATHAAEEEKKRRIKEAEQEIAKMVVLGIEKTVRQGK